MTRLTSNDLLNLDLKLRNYDGELMSKTGLNLRQIATHAAGVVDHVLAAAAVNHLVAVIPITAGAGLITGFAETVRSIITHLGFKSLITGETDVSGLAEAIARGAAVAFLADDRRFIAVNLRYGIVIDNAVATGRGYVSALNAMAKGLKGKEVLVLGAGQVGMAAVQFLQELNAVVSVSEIDQNKVQLLKNQGINVVEMNVAEVLPSYKYLVEATPQPEFIKKEHLHPEVRLAAPGIPLGLTFKAYEATRDQVIHDPLQIGVATMLALVASDL